MRPSASVSAALRSSSRQSSTRTPLAGRPRSTSRTWVEREALIGRPLADEPGKGRRQRDEGERSCRESCRLAAMFLCDDLLLCAHELAVPDDLLAGDIEAVDAMRTG